MLKMRKGRGEGFEANRGGPDAGDRARDAGA
jgi:hypothetical protein